jgi:hypothetical protein
VTTKSKSVTVPVNECSRCGHEWVQRIPKRPLKCPNCQTPNWDKPAGYRKNGRAKAVKPRVRAGTKLKQEMAEVAETVD